MYLLNKLMKIVNVNILTYLKNHYCSFKPEKIFGNRSWLKPLLHLN